MRDAGKPDASGAGQQPPRGARIALCASDEAIRIRIEELLGVAGHEIVDTGSSLEDLIGAAPATDPQLVVLARAFEPFSTSAEIRLLRAKLGELPLVLVACGSIGRGARKIALSQADGLVEEANIETALVATVNCALTDQLCVPVALRQPLAQPVLSYREKQVLELVLAGLTNGEIAARLFLSESTVKSHLASSFRKLGVSSRTEAARRVRDPDSGLELSLQTVAAAAAPLTPPELV